MDAQLHSGSGRRWFDAAVVLVLVIGLVGLSRAAGEVQAQDQEPPVLLLSAAVRGRVGDIAFAPGDILLHRMGTDEWEMFFDSSDVGISGNVSAFTIDPYYGNLYLVVGSRQRIPGFGIAGPHQILQASQTNNALWKSRFGRSSEPDLLSSSGEAIDALGYGWAGGGGYEFSLSTAGSFRIQSNWGNNGTPGYCVGRDEDIVSPWLDDEGGVRGGCGIFLDGSNVPGLGLEDITGLSMPNDWQSNPFYISVGGAFTIGGVSGGPDDILSIQKNEDGTYRVTKFWDGRAEGFPYALDGIEVLQLSSDW